MREDCGVGVEVRRVVQVDEVGEWVPFSLQELRLAEENKLKESYPGRMLVGKSPSRYSPCKDLMTFVDVISRWKFEKRAKRSCAVRLSFCSVAPR